MKEYSVKICDRGMTVELRYENSSIRALFKEEYATEVMVWIKKANYNSIKAQLNP